MILRLRKLRHGLKRVLAMGDPVCESKEHRRPTAAYLGRSSEAVSGPDVLTAGLLPLTSRMRMSTTSSRQTLKASPESEAVIKESVLAPCRIPALLRHGSCPRLCPLLGSDTEVDGLNFLPPRLTLSLGYSDPLFPASTALGLQSQTWPCLAS